PCLDDCVSIPNRQGNLLLNVDFSRAKLANQTLLINGFQQARSECAMNRERRIDNLPSEHVVSCGGLNHLGVLSSWRFKFSRSARRTARSIRPTMPPRANSTISSRKTPIQKYQ